MKTLGCDPAEIQPVEPRRPRAKQARTALALAVAVAALGCDDDDPTIIDTDPSVNGGATAGTNGGTTTGSSTGQTASTGASATSGNGTTGSGASTPDNGAGAGPTGETGSAGSNGGTTGDASGGTTGAAGTCTRELLSSMVDNYFTALEAHDPTMLPTSSDVKFTENGKVLELGAGLWTSAGALVYEHSALDTELCMTVSEAVVPDGGTNTPVGLRLKVEGSMITEVETIVARPGAYSVASNPDAIIASASLQWEESVPASQRATRSEIAQWLTTYFEDFPDGGCNLADDCLRLENGGGSFDCSFGASCSKDGSGGGGGLLGGLFDLPGGLLDVKPARLVVVDEETGVGVGFTMFLGNTDFHMIKMHGGEVHAVHTILARADGSGWD